MKSTHLFFLIMTLCGATFMAGVPAAVRAATISYTYDEAGRLKGADYGNDKVISYTYDNNGNLLKREATQAPTFTAYVSAGDCGGLSPCYHTVDKAVSEAPDNALIKVAAEVFSGDITVDEGKTLTIEWGYNENFSSNTGVTEVQGTFTAKDKTIIRSGTIQAK